VNGIQQMPIHGKSMAPTFDDTDAEEHRETQYFEMFVNRGIYHKGWTAVTRHSIPWAQTELPAYDDDVWELYGPDDWTQANDLAAEEPGKLAEMQRLFLIEAARYNVLPLDDRRFERFNPDMAGRPTLVRGTSQTLFGGMSRLSENSVLAIKNKSHAITAEVEIPDGGSTEGVILAQGGAFGGFSLYAKDGKPAYCYNTFGVERYKVYGSDVLASGTRQIRMEFDYDGGGLGKGGGVTLFVDGNKVGEGRVDMTVPMLFSADETTDVGSDSATPVSDDHGPTETHFTGQVNWVQIDIDEAAEDTDHFITPEERMRIVMARQ
jgi:arylsulfatase